VGVFTTLPNADGTGGVESSYDSYARTAHQDWSTLVIGTTAARRVNVGAIEMVAVGLGDPGETIVGWGIWDASTSGNLLHFGPMRNASGVEAPVAIVAGDQIRWTDGELKVQLRPSSDQTGSVVMETVYGPTQTTDATPATKDLYTLTDEEAAHVEVLLVAKHTTGGATDYHYRRRITASYDRDDGGSGTALWYQHSAEADGAETRVTLTTATASLVLSGNTIQAQYTGEAGKNLDWYAVVKVITVDGF